MGQDRARIILRRSEWDWAGIKADAMDNIEVDDDGSKVGRIFLGTVFTLTPSGKYYTPWANSNVNEDEAGEDEKFNEALDTVAGKHKMFIENELDDPCDLFAGIVIEEEN